MLGLLIKGARPLRLTPMLVLCRPLGGALGFCPLFLSTYWVRGIGLGAGWWGGVE